MDNNFDVFVKEHLQDILCEAEKEQALVMMKRKRKQARKPTVLKIERLEYTQDIQLQDCAVSPSFSQSQL